MAILVLVLLAGIFAYLALDARSMGKPARNLPYEIEAKARGEDLDAVSLNEQRKRQSWHRRYGIGKLSDMVWFWAMLSGGCLAAALMTAHG